MRAVVMRNGVLVLDEVPDPAPSAGEVVVKTLACGICGSDLHALKHTHEMVAASGDGGISFDPDADVVMGHEFCGELMESTPTLAAGTRVCSVPITQHDGALRTVGYANDVPGGYGEYLLLSESMLLPVPNGLATDHAALTEPMAVGAHAVEMARLAPDDVPLVIGCGPVGLSVILALKARGVGPVVAADFSPARRALAERCGADIVVDPSATSPYSTWHGLASVSLDGERLPENPLTGAPQLRPGVFFECVGVPGVIEQLMLGAPREGRIVVVGVCLQTDYFRPLIGVNKELSLQFVLGYSVAEFEQTLVHIANGAIDVSPLVTGHTGLDGVPDAFDRLATPAGDAKILVLPWEEEAPK